jgi:hypothetical protein
MTDNELKEDCLQEAGIDLGRYSHTELTEIKDALRRYHQAKLKLLGIADVVDCKHDNEIMRQGDGFVYSTCGDCGDEL